ncbi:replication factor A protein 3 [Auriscalpium vulgare]|uniref:Replication factor A protein 3 n=1 Tax=Auriscalpium vulgare TaxID=40419 RepID=A0ACB8S7J6_9AGAM|nr:replication factor A protein 3 [Auriscalpium vulgare]
MSTEHVSRRVNSARLGNFVTQKQPVRIVGKILKFADNAALMEASDGGQIKIVLGPEHNIVDTFVEVIGVPIDASSVRYVACTNMGTNLDLKFVNDVVEMTFDKKFDGRLF